MRTRRFIPALSVAVRAAALLTGITIPFADLRAEAKHVSKEQAIEAAVTKVQPAYPPMARQLKIEGGVELEASIGPDGSVEAVSIVSGNPVLTKPAAEALKKWRFKPFTEDGKPVQVVAPFHFNFRKEM